MSHQINQELAAMFEDVGNSLQYQGEAWVKVRSYLKVAEVLRGLDQPVPELIEAGRLDDLPGVGKAISKKIRQYLTDSTFPLLERLDDQIPQGTRALLRAGLAPSVVRHVEAGGYTSPEKLHAALDSGELTVDGVPSKLRSKLRDYITRR